MTHKLYYIKLIYIVYTYLKHHASYPSFLDS